MTEQPNTVTGTEGDEPELDGGQVFEDGEQPEDWAEPQDEGLEENPGGEEESEA